MMRAKFRVTSVADNGSFESLEMAAVCKADGYPADGSDENNTYAQWTPFAELRMSITNPALVGKFRRDQEFYVDFTEVK